MLCAVHCYSFLSEKVNYHESNVACIIINNAWFRTAELKQVRLVKYGVPSSLKSRSEAHRATRQDKREGLDLISITFRSAEKAAKRKGLRDQARASEAELTGAGEAGE